MKIINKNNFMIFSKDFYNYDYNKFYEFINNFFESPNNIKVKIYFLNSLNQFNFFNPYGKFEKWKCGFMTNNIIFVFSPEIIEKLTIHKKEEIPKIIVHELSHLFYNNLGFRNITLLNEGIATYLIYLFKNKTLKTNQKLDLSKINIINPNIPKKTYYPVGLDIINKIISKHKKEKLFDFLKKIKSFSDHKIISTFQKEFSN